MPRALRKNVDYEIHIVQKDPLGLVVALKVGWTHALLAQRFLNIVSDGLYLARICSGANYKIIGKGAGILVHFKNGQIFALFVLNCTHRWRNLPPPFLDHSFLSLLHTRSAKK